MINGALNLHWSSPWKRKKQVSGIEEIWIFDGWNTDSAFWNYSSARVDRILGKSIVLFDIFTTPMWPWLVACFFWVPDLIWSKFLQPFYFAWMNIGSVLGWINTRIIMLLMFYSMMLPIGLLLRFLGKNTMDSKALKLSYRVVVSKQIEKNYLERLYYCWIYWKIYERLCKSEKILAVTDYSSDAVAQWIDCVRSRDCSGSVCLYIILELEDDWCQ